MTYRTVRTERLPWLQSGCRRGLEFWPQRLRRHDQVGPLLQALVQPFKQWRFWGPYSSWNHSTVAHLQKSTEQPSRPATVESGCTGQGVFGYPLNVSFSTTFEPANTCLTFLLSLQEGLKTSLDGGCVLCSVFLKSLSATVPAMPLQHAWRCASLGRVPWRTVRPLYK